MNIDKYISSLEKFVNKYLNPLIYTILLIIFAVTLYFTYANVYKTAITPNQIENSEIIAKKQKVNITLFKEIQKKIDEKNDQSLNNIQYPFEK